MSDQPTSSTTPTGHQSSPRSSPQSSPQSDPQTGTVADPRGPGAQPLSERGTNRSLRPGSPAFKELIVRGWGERPPPPGRAEVAPWAAGRREMLSQLFPGDRLVVPAGPLKVRSNDTDYRYRPHAAFSHLTGLGSDREPDAVLVLEPRAKDEGGGDGGGHEALLFVRPRAERHSEEFYADARYGEFWVGVRPSLEETTAELGITARHVDDLAAALDGLLPDGTDPTAEAAPADGGSASTDAADASGVSRLRVVVDADPAVSAAVGRSFADGAPLATDGDDELSELLSTMRLVKDEWEIGQMREAVAATVTGFEQVVCSLPRAAAHRRGERVVETAFEGVARREGNGVGYETIAAAGEHACTLHWIRNDGPVPGDALVLVDAGVEIESLYTADVTRTLPVSGRYTDVQRRVYSAVLDAADAGFAACRPGNVFRDVHDAAMGVIASRLHEWGILDVSVEEALDADEGGQHRRWMVHGTSHHLGIDVHDCAQARRDAYLDAELVPGMILTIEPGLYFKPDDLLVPEELRGIGVRIEDDVLVTADGCENLSAALPREPGAVEAWMASLR